MTEEYRGLLEREAAYLYERLFGGPAERKIVERYVAAHALYIPEPSERGKRVMETILNGRLDAEAIEYALRARRRERVLTAKIQTLFYLAEAQAEHYGDFVNLTPGRARAWAALASALFASGVKFVKGAWLVRRHGL